MRFLTAKAHEERATTPPQSSLVKRPMSEPVITRYAGVPDKIYVDGLARRPVYRHALGDRPSNSLLNMSLIRPDDCSS